MKLFCYCAEHTTEGVQNTHPKIRALGSSASSWLPNVGAKFSAILAPSFEPLPVDPRSSSTRNLPELSPNELPKWRLRGQPEVSNFTQGCALGARTWSMIDASNIDFGPSRSSMKGARHAGTERCG